jgi:DNA-binding transcriptional LysR family regulator
MDIDLKLLQYAVVLARHRHFGRAAAALRISQPTLSRNIAALEKQLGMRLFERSRVDIAATAAGVDVLKMAEELVGRAKAISNRLEMVRKGRGGRLRVAASTYVCDLAVYPAMIDLLNTNPSIGVEVLEREWSGTLDLVMADQADFAVMAVDRLATTPGLRIDPLGVLEFHVVCRAGHPLLTKPALQPSDTAAHRFVYMRQPLGRHLDAEELDVDASIDPVTGELVPSISVSSCRRMLQVVAETNAITIAHISQVQADIDAGRLAVLSLPWRKRTRAQIGFVYKRQRTLLPAARAFMSLIRKRMKSVID